MNWESNTKIDYSATFIISLLKAISKLKLEKLNIQFDVPKRAVALSIKNAISQFFKSQLGLQKMYFHANISETMLGIGIFQYLPTYIKIHTKDLKAENEELIKIQRNYFCFVGPYFIQWMIPQDQRHSWRIWRRYSQQGKDKNYINSIKKKTASSSTPFTIIEKNCDFSIFIWIV